MMFVILVIFLISPVLSSEIERDLPIFEEGQSEDTDKETTYNFEQGTADVKAGTSVSGTDKGYKFSQVDNLETTNSDIIEQGESVESNRDYSFSAAKADKATLQSTPAPTTMQTIRNLFTASNGKLTFDSAETFDTEENNNIQKIHGEDVMDAVFDNQAFQTAGASYIELGNNKYANVNNLHYIFNSQQTTYTYAESSVADMAEIQSGDVVLLGSSKIIAQYADIISTDEVTFFM